MPISTKAWDNLSGKFDTYRPKAFVGAIDNMLAVWPEILKFVKKRFKNPKGLRALEYGCGVGMFCGELKKSGFDIIGVDISPKMINTAKRHLGKKILFLVGDGKTVLETAKKQGQFSLISAIMVFQFIKDIKACLTQLKNSLKKGGYIIFAVHNPKFLAIRKITNRLNLVRTKIFVPIHPKNVKDYDKIFTALGFKKILEKHLYPSKSFRKIYPPKTPKYLLLAYKKL